MYNTTLGASPEEYHGVRDLKNEKQSYARQQDQNQPCTPRAYLPPVS